MTDAEAHAHAIVKELVELWTKSEFDRATFALGMLSAVLEMAEAAPALDYADRLRITEAAGALYACVGRTLSPEERGRIDIAVAQRLAQ